MLVDKIDFFNNAALKIHNNSHKKALLLNDNPLYSDSITQITFCGNDKNPNQIAVLSAECIPYAQMGGLGAVTKDMTTAYKRHFPEKDVRLFLPYYNSPYGIKEDSIYLSPDGDRFELQDTGLKADVKYGIKNTTANLFKIKNPVDGVPVYLVSLSELSNIKKPYSGDYISLFKAYSAFSHAVVDLLRQTKDSDENFNPKIIHTKDWHVIHSILASKDAELKTIHEISNGNGNMQGKIKPLGAVIYDFDEDQIQRLLKDEGFKDSLYQIAINYPEILLKGIKTNNLNSLINNPETELKILNNIADNYEVVMYKSKKDLALHQQINNDIVRVFPDVNWDEHQDFNPTVSAINKADAWFTTSKTHFRELVTDARFSSKSLYNMLRLNLDKGDGILNKIDVNRYNPNSKLQIKFPYTLESYKDGKKANKEFLFDSFSKENVKNKIFSTKLIKDTNNMLISGYLDKNYIDKPLIVNISRFDTNQKGCDITLKTISEVLKNNEDATFILGFPGVMSSDKRTKKEVQKFIKTIVNNPKYRGRIVLIDSFLPIQQYVAGADFSLIPSRSETCGLVGYQSMRFGAIPIATPVGSMNDKLITPEQDIYKAMGFKTPAHFMYCSHPEHILANTINEACIFYRELPEQLNRMIKNSMAFNSDWSTAIDEQNDLYEKVASGQKINDMTLNDLREPDDIVKINMYNEKEINKLKKADVLVVLPHSDDEIFFLPMLKYIKEGKSVQVVYAMANDKGHYKEGAPSTPDAMKKHRREESLASLYSLGITRNPLQLNIPDIELSYGQNPQKVTDYLSEILDKVHPEIVLSYGPDGTTGNPDHKKLGELVFNAVQDKKKENNEDIKLYQMAFSDKKVQNLRDIMSTAYTDAFDFVSGVPDEEIVETVDINEFKDKIRKSLKMHNSQWHKEEVDGFIKYYCENGAAYRQLKAYPVIGIPNHPWIDKRNEFSNKYGKELKQNGDGTAVYLQPKNCHARLEIKIPKKDNKPKTTITFNASDLGITKEHISDDIAEMLLNKLDLITQLPQFNNLKTLQIISKNDTSKEKNIIRIPFAELKQISKYITDIVNNPENLNLYLREYPDSKVKIKKDTKISY